MDPVHFAMVGIISLAFGLVTPPYGLLLFMMSKIANVPLSALVRAAFPFILVMLVALALVTVIPGLVLWLPRLGGYTG